MFAVLLGHVPFETRHCRIFVPVVNPNTWVVALDAELIVPVPLISDQVPVPRVGSVAESVAVDAHMV
jgi:hypothetical protein